MTYIKPDRRVAVDTIIQGLVTRLKSIDATKEDLSYVVTQVVMGALRPTRGWTYSALSDSVAALRDAADEIKQRCISTREQMVLGVYGDASELFQAEVDLDKEYSALFKIDEKPITETAAEMYQATIDEVMDRR